MRHLGKYFALRIFGAIPQSVCRQKQPFPPLLKGPKYDTVAIAIKAERQLRQVVGETVGLPGYPVAIAIKAERRYGGGSGVQPPSVVAQWQIGPKSAEWPFAWKWFTPCKYIPWWKRGRCRYHLAAARSYSLTLPTSPCGGTVVFLDGVDGSFVGRGAV